MNTRLSSLWRKNKYVSAVLLFLMLHPEDNVGISIREIARAINEDRNKVRRALVWLESNGFIESRKDGKSFTYKVRAEKKEISIETSKKPEKEKKKGIDTFFKAIKVSNGNNQDDGSDTISDPVSDIVSGETVDDISNVLEDIGDSELGDCSEVDSHIVSDIVSPNRGGHTVSEDVSGSVSNVVSGETDGDESKLLRCMACRESENCSEVGSGSVSNIVSKPQENSENTDKLREAVSHTVSNVVSGETAGDIVNSLEIDDISKCEDCSEVVLHSVSGGNNGEIATQEKQKEQKEKKKVIQRKKEKQEKEKEINLDSIDLDVSVISEEENDTLSDTEKKVIAMDVATEIYEYYMSKLRAGKRQDSIDKIHRLLLGTHYSDKKRVYTPKEIYTIIDNYAKVATGGRDAMYPPDKMFGRDAHFKLFVEGSVGMDTKQQEIETQMKAMDDAAEIFHYYTTHVRRSGSSGYSKQEAIHRIQNILLGRSELSRHYSKEEIHKAIEKYKYDKRSSEEKYRAAPQNFFGGNKFYIRDYLENEAVEIPKAKVDSKPKDDDFVELKF